MGIAQNIHDKLTQSFAPEHLRVSDESANHAGHAGVLESGRSGETHFHVLIVSARFAGLSRVERQRRVYAELAEEFRGGLHALSLTALTPDEQASRGA